MAALQIFHIRTYDGKITENIILVETDRDYTNACLKIRSSHYTNDSINIWVRQQSHYVWVCNYADQILVKYTAKQMTPRVLLSEKWDVQLPLWVDDDIVINEKLLDLDISKTDNKRFENILLVHYFGSILQTERMDDNNLAQIVNSITGIHSKDKFDTHPILINCLNEKTKSWKEVTTVQWVKDVCDRLTGDLENLWKEITLWTILGNYPARLLEYVVTPQVATYLRRIPLAALKSLSLNRVAEEQALTQIKLYIDEMKSSVKSIVELRKVINCFSGKTIQEYQFLLDLLKDAKLTLPQEEIEHIKSKFKTCSGTNAAKFSILNKFLDVPKPSIPKIDEKWDTEKWIRWTFDEYIAYRNWQTQNKIFNTDVEKVTKLFSDWYIDQYASIQQNSEYSLIHCLQNWTSEINNDSLSLIILVDSLPLTYWDLFNSEFKRAGFFRHDFQFKFAPLPSDTFHSKPHIFSGNWDVSEKDYKSILQHRVECDYQKKRFVYLHNLKSLSELEPLEEPSIIVFNFLDIDEILHLNVELKDSTYEDEIYRVVARLANSAAKLMEGSSQNNYKMSVYITTDHGATRILKKETSSFDSKLVKKLFSNEKQRFAVLEKNEISKIPENLWALGYKFNNPFQNQEQVYFIPSGHNTVKVSQKGSGHTHGGASPEEIIVPTAIFRLEKAAWQKIGARFIDLSVDPQTGNVLFYIQRIVPIRLEMQNPNDVEIKITNIEILCPSVDIKGSMLPSISKKSTAIAEVNCYFDKSALKEKDFIIRVEYQIVDEERSLELTTAAEYKSAMSGGFSLKYLK